MGEYTIVNRIPDQIEVFPETVRIGTILQYRDIYFNLPDFQRRFVWGKIDQQNLMQTLLNNRHLPAILAYRDGEKYYILDGQQRLTSIFRFVNGDYPTGRTRGLKAAYLHQNKYWMELSDDARERLLRYKIRYEILLENDRQRLMDVYKDAQHLKRLVGAEVAYVSDSKTKYVALHISENPYFTEIYRGKDDRMQTFKMSLIPTELELFKITSDLRDHRLISVGAGGRDELITDDIVERVDEKLLYAAHVFAGVETKEPNSIIVHYQAVSFLVFAGYDLSASKQGCLAEWYANVVTGGRFYGAITKNSYQMAFWQSRLMDLALSPGLVVSHDQCRLNIERLASWLRNQQYCAECRSYVSMKEIHRHAFLANDQCKAYLPIRMISA